MHHVPLAFQCMYGPSDERVKMGMGRCGVIFLEEGRLPGLLYADDLVLCGESEEDLRTMVGWFVEVCIRKGVKVNGGRSKVMALNGEERLECDVYVDGIRLEHLSEFISVERVF